MKIRSVTVEEAKRLQKEGPGAPGWNSSMQEDLGEIKEITQLRGGKCQLAGARWWYLGLLEVSSGDTATDSCLDHPISNPTLDHPETCREKHKNPYCRYPFGKHVSLSIT